MTCELVNNTYRHSSTCSCNRIPGRLLRRERNTMNMEEKAYNILATKKKNHRDMATAVPDRKASGDFHRPVYQAATLIREQGETGSVPEQ